MADLSSRRLCFCPFKRGQGLIDYQGESKRRRLLCYAGRKSPSRQLDDFEIVMLISSFIQTRRPVIQASLLLSFLKGEGLNQDAFGVFGEIMSSADRVRRVLLCSHTKEVAVFWISPDAHCHRVVFYAVNLISTRPV